MQTAEAIARRRAHHLKDQLKDAPPFQDTGLNDESGDAFAALLAACLGLPDEADSA